MKDKLFIAHIEEITELLQLLVETDPVLLNDLSSVEVGSSIDKNALKKAISEVSDPKLKEEFQNRLKNADSSRKIELVNRYGPILLSNRIIRSTLGKNNKNAKSYLKKIYLQVGLSLLFYFELLYKHLVIKVF